MAPPDSAKSRNGHDLRDRVGEDVDDELADVVVDPAPGPDRGDDRGEVVVGEHHRRGLAGDVGARGAHGHADVGPAQRRGVVDAVTGHRHHVAEGLQPGGDPQLVLRGAPGEDRLAARAQDRVEARVVHPAELLAGHQGRRPDAVTDAGVVGHGDGRAPVVTGDHVHREPGGVGQADGTRDRVAHRVGERDEAQQREVLLDLGPVVRAPGRASRGRRRRSAGRRGRRARRAARLTASRVAGSRGTTRPWVRVVEQRASTLSGAPLVAAVSGPSASAGGTSTVISRRRGSKWKVAARAGGIGGSSGASRSAARSRAISVGSPDPLVRSALVQVRSTAAIAVALAALGRWWADAVPDGVDAHPVLGQGPGLVGADDVGRPEGLDRAQPLDQTAVPRHLGDADGEREGDRGQQPLGDVGDQQADREHRGLARG